MSDQIQKLTNQMLPYLEKYSLAMEEMKKVIVGQEHLLQGLFVALLADGHVLLEGLPGLAKTLTVNTFAKVMQCDFKRVQFTPDLLPGDLIGTSIFNPKEGTFSVNKGPIFTQILLADEINRAPAKVQSALLEVMQEKQITIGKETFKVEAPYLVLATQNPIEQEGTYPLPEAQTDRFMMKIKIKYPSKEEEKKILKTMGTTGEKPTPKGILTPEFILQTRALVNEVYVDEKVENYILDLVCATRDPKRYNLPIDGWLMYGASPRASIALKLAAKAHAFLSGKAFVTPYNVQQVGMDILCHRLRRSYEAEAEEITTEKIIEILFNTISAP